MAHFYSVSAQQAGVANEMAHVSIFLEAYDDAPPYPYLDRVICQWRRAEEKIREQCGLPSVQPYPTCFNPTRGHTNPTNNPTTNPTQPPTSPPAVVVDIPPFSILPINNTTESTHETSTTTTTTTIDTLITNSNTSTISSVSSRGFNPDQSQTGGSKRRLRATANDILRDSTTTKTTKKKRKIQMDPINWREPDWTEQEWEQFIQAYSAHTNGNASQSQRKLLEGSHSIYHNYQPLIDVKTEYYYRYSGTQTAPPCYGPFTPETRGNTNHWRVMKDPIRVHPRQIKEMHRLLRERTAPSDDPNTDNACKTDTAAKIVNEETGEISVARPLQSFHQSHFKTFCECKDWKSKWPEDQAWCEIDSGDYTASYSRFYQQPYNFQTHGQF